MLHGLIGFIALVAIAVAILLVAYAVCWSIGRLVPRHILQFAGDVVFPVAFGLFIACVVVFIIYGIGEAICEAVH